MKLYCMLKGDSICRSAKREQNSKYRGLETAARPIVHPIGAGRDCRRRGSICGSVLRGAVFTEKKWVHCKHRKHIGRIDAISHCTDAGGLDTGGAVCTGGAGGYLSAKDK